MELLTPGSGLIIWQAIIFLALILILRKLAWGPIIQGLKQREQDIEGALQSAEEAKKEMEKLSSDNEKLMAEARAERDSMLKEAIAAAAKIKEEAKEETSVITAKMIEDAKASIENEKRAALTDVKNMVANLSLEISEKLVRTQLGDKEAQKSLIDEYVKDLNLN